MELYLHIPFCVRKCLYCDFLSAPAESGTIEKYVRRLCEEMSCYEDACRGYEVESVFIGGGTPSILTEQQICSVMEAAGEHFRIRRDAEITMECNPGTLTGSKADAMRSSGINRISLGLQSSDNRELEKLGRIHTWETFLCSYETAKKSGYQNINIDLMSALPGQTAESWEKTLTDVLQLHPAHISAYSLIIEEGTPFYDRYAKEDELRRRGGRPTLLPGEEEEREMYVRTKELLGQAGYHRYEISNYALDGFECRHNTGYWRRKNYLGLGLGSASLMENTRFRNTADLNSYLNHPFCHEEREILEPEDQMEEFMFLGLRMMQGVSRAEFENEFGVPIESVYSSALERLASQGLLILQKDRIFLTERGIDISNYVFTEFLQ